MAERAPLDVLAGQPDRGAVGEDRRERQLLGRRPVDACARSAARAAAPASREPVRACDGWRTPAARRAATRSARAADRAATAVSAFDAAPGGGASGSGSMKSCSGRSASIAACSVSVYLRSAASAWSACSVAAFDERLRPELAHGRVRGDLLVHDRLRERRLVPFVVPVSAIADQVDQEVALELRAIRKRQPRDLDARLRIVRVDVDDRDLEPARQTARVRRAVGVLGARREPELVVDDDVDRAAGAVAREVG